MKGKKKKIILDLDIIFVSCVKLLLFVVSLLCFFDKKKLCLLCGVWNSQMDECFFGMCRFVALGYGFQCGLWLLKGNFSPGIGLYLKRHFWIKL